MRGDAAGAREPMMTQQIRKIQKPRIRARRVRVDTFRPVGCVEVVIWFPFLA
jgi:hypothetical protein